MTALHSFTETAKSVTLTALPVFIADDIMAPQEWSQVAVDVLAQKYFRKAGVPDRTEPVAEDGVPDWLQRRRPAEGAVLGAERDARQVFHRLAGAWTYWGWKGGYFATEDGRARLLRRNVRHAGDPDAPRRTRRNGSTPACTGLMASTAQRRAITTSTHKTVKLVAPRPPPTSIRSPMPASSSRSPTIW